MQIRAFVKKAKLSFLTGRAGPVGAVVAYRTRLPYSQTSLHALERTEKRESHQGRRRFSSMLRDERKERPTGLPIAFSDDEQGVFFEEPEEPQLLRWVILGQREASEVICAVFECPDGGYVELRNWPHDTLVLGRFDRGDRTFHAVASELLTGDEVIAEGARRWHEKSFFKAGKHQFGLAQFAARTALGLDRWILLVFVAWTLAILHRTPEMSLEAAAFTALITVLSFIHLNVLLWTFATNAEFLRQHGYSLTYARCNS